MRRIPKPRDPVLFFCTAIALLSVVVSALYFTRSQNIRDDLSRREAVKAEIILEYDEPGADGKTAWHSMDTSSPGQIRELMAIVDRYPYNQKFDFSKIGFWEGSTQPRTAVWVMLNCAPENGKNIWAQELVYSDGYMAANLSDGKLFPCGIGRFGDSRTKEYCARL